MDAPLYLECTFSHHSVNCFLKVTNRFNFIYFHIGLPIPIFQFLKKKKIKRGRPGCVNKSLSRLLTLDISEFSPKYQSFPSGHMGVASSLASACGNTYSNDSKFFDTHQNKLYEKYNQFKWNICCTHGWTSPNW